jgi:hypothetical protein
LADGSRGAEDTDVHDALLGSFARWGFARDAVMA